LSNFLGRFDAPRWNMIAPEEIERVDVLYGPFSAIYPGNSIGSTVAVRTRRPDALEISARTTAFTERFEEYGLADTYDGYQFSGFLGDRFASDAWFTLAVNHQDSVGHPMQYYARSAGADGQFAQLDGPAVPVTGVRFDVDPQGRRRAVFGAGSGAIDRTRQDQAKLSAGVPLADWLEVHGFAATWRNETRNENRTFMRDEHGAPVWSGRVLADGVVFDVPQTALAPSERQESHLQWGATLRTTRGAGWNGSLVYSDYEIRTDRTHSAHTPDPLAVHGGPGSLEKRDGTGWRTFEAQGVYSPRPGDWVDGAHTLSFGYHQNEYRLRNPIYTLSDWRTGAGVLDQNVFGATRLRALYLQDRWQMTDEWTLTLGARYEDWRAHDGGQRAGDVVIDYAARRKSAWSPKASLAYSPDPDWSLRLSAGRGVRFPTVAELFQGTVRSSSITVNDPFLEPEVSDALEFTVERVFEHGQARVSLFQDDVHDSIYAQTNIIVTPNVTNVQNVDRVRTRGVEMAFALQPPNMDTLSLEGAVAHVHTRILENDNNPPTVGNRWPRIPEWRGHLQLAWRPSQPWLATLGLRHSGRMYNRLENDDVNPDTYGGVSRFTTLDARIAFTTPGGVELALGMDNLTSEQSYQAHPFPQRTGFLEARWSFEGGR
ncbi:MAG TPA: TonB-dependent receptor, partial [Steroidobacter sp.]|nr:TonB-dependent receptor [Steroidobacter sp.]